jgi:hypothetical protein
LFPGKPRADLSPKFADRVLADAPAGSVLVESCSNEFSGMAGFEKRLNRFARG